MSDTNELIETDFTICFPWERVFMTANINSQV